MSRYRWGPDNRDCYDQGYDDARRGRMSHGHEARGDSDCDRAYRDGRGDYERRRREEREETRLEEERYEQHLEEQLRERMAEEERGDG